MATSKDGGLRTVSFFRILCNNADGPVRFEQQDWQALLGKIQRLSLRDRTYEGPSRRLIGEPLFVDGDYALKILEPRDEHSWLEILRADEAGVANPIDQDLVGTLVETSVVAFLDEKNLFGIIRGSTSSPTHAAVAEWLDHLKINGRTMVDPDKFHLSAEPALSRRQKQQLESADGVNEASMRISTSKARALEDAGSETVGRTLRALQDTYGDLVVTVTLRVPRGKKNDAARALLKEETQRWEQVNEHADAVSATLVHYDAEAKAHHEKVNFVSQRITMQQGVPMTNDQGDPIRNDSAVRAIRVAAWDLRDEIATVY